MSCINLGQLISNAVRIKTEGKRRLQISVEFSIQGNARATIKYVNCVPSQILTYHVSFHIQGMEKFQLDGSSFWTSSGCWGAGVSTGNVPS